MIREKDITREAMATYETDELWAIVRSTSVGTEIGARAVTNAKAELRRRGESSVGL